MEITLNRMEQKLIQIWLRKGLETPEMFKQLQDGAKSHPNESVRKHARRRLYEQKVLRGILAKTTPVVFGRRYSNEELLAHAIDGKLTLYRAKHEPTGMFYGPTIKSWCESTKKTINVNLRLEPKYYTSKPSLAWLSRFVDHKGVWHKNREHDFSVEKFTPNGWALA